MKIVCVEDKFPLECGKSLVYTKPDTAIGNVEQPFYIPDFSDKFKIQTGISVKIDKTGKCIPVKFAHNHYREISLSISFKAQGFEQSQSDIAQAFDYSTWMGTFLDKTSMEKQICKFYDDQTIWQSSIDFEKIDKSICFVSDYYTLRKGDVVIIFKDTEKYATQGVDYKGEINGSQNILVEVK